MSWFDATGIASLAKNALKEAQKTIDKALDITEDEDEHDESDNLKSSSSTSSISVKSAEQLSPNSEQSDTSMNMIKQSTSNPILSTVATATSASNLWGSFTGSFYANNPNNVENQAAVTIAPTSTSEARLISTKNDEKTSNASAGGANTSGRTSSASASESVELLSSPITPSSSLTSPSASM